MVEPCTDPWQRAGCRPCMDFPVHHGVTLPQMLWWPHREPVPCRPQFRSSGPGRGVSSYLVPPPAHLEVTRTCHLFRRSHPKHSRDRRVPD